LESKAYERELKIPAPTRDVTVLFRILETHLEGVTAEAPIIAVELSAIPTRQEQKQFALFESGLRDPNKFFETLARLQALLGNGRVGTPVLDDTWRADVFHIETPRFEGVEKPAPSPAPSPGLPLRRFRPPLPAHVHLEDGRPVAVFSEHAFGPVRKSCGPWRSSGQWWGGQGWAREEWDVQLEAGLYRLAQEQGTWVLEGAYG
jgi:protein ImuB